MYALLRSASCIAARRRVRAFACEAPAPLRLLCRHGELAFFDKPAGMLVHPDARRPPLRAGTRYALHEAAALLGTSGVHFASRLDAATSGVLVAATSPRAAHALQAVWTGAGVVVKEYIALVSRPPASDAWTAERPLTARAMGGARKPLHTLRARRGEGEATVGDTPHSRGGDDAASTGELQAARTDFRVLARFPPAASADGLPFETALLRCVLHTGRWHQIRRHLAHAGHHVLGDTTHGKLRYNGPARAVLDLQRLFLHAAAVRVDFAAAAAGLPPGPPLRVIAPLPRQLTRAAERLPGWAAAATALGAAGLMATD